MGQDTVADVLNQIMNARRARQRAVVTTNFSKLLLNVLSLMKERGYIDYEIEEGVLRVVLKEVTKCKAIKPRYAVNQKSINKYVRRFLPSRNFGHVVISTSRGLMTHQKARENKIGGSLIAYFY